jgi:DNA helicase-2/ATP-dependent DNA helicase PcrA
MSDFDTIYHQLNDAQKKAVDSIYGPVLVIAGPGTGKTQLLSARVANILKTTDALPQNILCLTFTDNGAIAMRERLTRFIGQAAYDVHIGTYHAFGSTIINRFPEYFNEFRLERPVDELEKRHILSGIIDATDYRSPIKQTRHHLGDLVSTISELKRGLLTPQALRTIAADNVQAINTVSPLISTHLAPYTKMMPRKWDVASRLFTDIQTILANHAATGPEPVPSLLALASADLAAALDQAAQASKGQTKPLTAWKNKWLIKNNKNEFIIAGALEAARVSALGDVLESYQATLNQKGLYDFDDMILQAIAALERNDDLRFTLQERYQFILLDEFQDTNAAQLRLIQLLTDNPVHEGKPNVLAVGDDDQAIYAFQGAQYSNMLDFFKLYRNVQIISLEDNYRSQAEILHTAHTIASQIEARLHTHFSGVTKKLTARNSRLPAVMLQRRMYQSAIAERAAISDHIAGLIADGVKPSEIAILAPKHKYLEPLIPYLLDRSIPVSYEKRENILQTPVVQQLLTMSRLIVAVRNNNHAIANSLWPQVLSYDFWDFTVADIWRLSWQATDHHIPWSQLLLDHAVFRHAALLFIVLAAKVDSEPLEIMLDALIGTTEVKTHDRALPSVRSPLRDYYLAKQGPVVLYETTSQLTVLRSKLRAHQTAQQRLLTLADLLDFTNLYEAAEQPMLNTSPYNQSADSVQLMTVFKAKGLEFDHVFLLSCQDDVWGSRAGGAGNKLTLPANLAHIRHAGTTDDERLRVLFVAITRARYGLHMTSYAQSYTGKTTEPIKYFEEVRNEQTTINGILPAPHATVLFDNKEAPSLENLSLNWQQRHTTTDTTLQALLRKRVQQYQLSPTHLTHFIDLKHGGPDSFLLGTLLRFPSAPTQDILFGNAVHRTLEWLQNETNRHRTIPSVAAACDYAGKLITQDPLDAEQKILLHNRAKATLQAYLNGTPTRFRPGNVAEKSFRQEGSFIGDVHLGGKIDLLEIDTKDRLITVVDYKTGRLGSDATKLHRYTLQLYCYKMLVEQSHTYRGYVVEQGKLIFVEPDDESRIVEKVIDFKPAQTQRVAALLTAMWHCVQSVSMPDVSAYTDSLTDLKKFEDWLIASYADSML